MIEILALFGALGALAKRAKQRRLDPYVTSFVAGLGWVIFFLLSASMGLVAVLLRWLWIGGIYLYVENSGGGAKASDTWQCPDCTMFNDPGTLVCLCGYENPETA